MKRFLPKVQVVLCRPQVPRGRCRYCSCTMSRPCRLADGGPCAWYDAYETVCSNPKCVQRAKKTVRALEQMGEAIQKAVRSGFILASAPNPRIMNAVRRARRAERRKKL